MPDGSIYARISKKLKDEMTSLDTQEASCRRLAQKLGATIPDQFVYKEDWPGDTLDRPLMSTLITNIKKRAFDHLIVHATDRLARNPIHLAIVADYCARAGIEIHFVTEPLDSSPEGQLILYVKGYAAQIEREKIRERTVRGRKDRVIHGKLATGGVGLFGYDYDKKTGKRTINEEQAEVVRMIFRLLVEENLTLGRICLKLTDMGIPSPKDAGHWGRSTIGRLVRQEAYTGTSYGLKYQSVPSPRTQRKRYLNNRRELRDPDEWVSLPDVTPAIISRELFDRTQRILARHQALSPRNTKREYLLSGRVKCGLCGRAMGISPYKDSLHYFRCSGRSRVFAAVACKNREPNGGKLEEQVWLKVKEAYLHPEVILDDLKRRMEEEEDPRLNDSLQTVTNRLKRLKDQDARLARLYVLGELDDDSLKKAAAALKQEKKLLEDEQERLSQKAASVEHLRQQEVSFREFCARAAKNIEEFTFVEKRDALEGLEVEVVIYPDKTVLQGILPTAIVSQPS